MFLGSGAKSFAPPAARRAHALAGRGRDPRAGLQRRVQVTLSDALAESSQYVTRSTVVDVVLADAAVTAIAATSTVTSDARMHPGYCHRSWRRLDAAGSR